MKKAFLLGFIAGATCGDVSNNPYTDGYENFDIWISGFLSAKEWWEEFDEDA
jgi:hypothetical protein